MFSFLAALFFTAIVFIPWVWCFWLTGQVLDARLIALEAKLDAAKANSDEESPDS
jgi:hypothetical protein